ncbi:hypothetical protein DUNSADRAFT_11669 [Dunaliella salina]|uniref:Small ribosomal subunit protein mS35 mitochondrial conserved domain-containing protein n=1 Tax=Dunaliella salina TaxID=3046 RepID=A0ABQ7GCX6_DUNSA|nr:hypothetical protein DUNSADRAFT_11669 [Dunaliella salina]|eukprot:KAF5832423.1 hypothetical protein DUNSADRAFT_11669 [Dunaliella salina]
MRRSVRLFGPHFCHLPSHQQPACAALTLLGCSKQTTLLPGNGIRTYSQPATSENHAVGDGQPEDADFKLMQAVLSRVGPPPEMREAHRTNDVSRIRFGDLPATTNWMESFVGSGSSGGYSASGNPGPQSGDAIYDIPAWLQANVPAHDTTPKSPLYHWVSWMNENLPQDQRRLYLALHEHLQHEPRRQAIMAKAQFELACLWDWQHRRVAAGLPPEWTQQEQEAARSAILAEAEKEARSLQTSAAAARARAASEASVAAGGQPTLIPSSSSSSSSATRGKGKAGSHGIQPGGVSAPAANSPLERMAAGVRAGTAEAEAAVADAQRWLIQDPSNSAMLPDMHAALQQAHEAAACCSTAAAAGDVKTFEQSANLAERAGGMAQRIAAAVAPHLVGAGGHNEAAAALEGTKARSKAELRSKEGGKGPKEEGPLSGMSLFLKRAEHREEEAEKERKERMLKLSQHLGLNRREQALIHALDLDPGLLLQHRAAGTASASEQAVGGSRSSGSPGLQPLLSTFMARLESGKKHMAAGGGGSRAVALMRSQSEARTREEAELADALSLTGAAERPTPPPGSGNSAALKTKRAQLGSRELAAQAQAALQRAREARQQQTAQEKQQGTGKAQLQAEAGSLAVSEGGVDRLTWSQLAAFNHEVKYQDVLLRRDLTQRVWAELAPRTPAADPFTKTDTNTTTTSTTPSTPSSPVNPGGASSSTAAGSLATSASSSSSDRTHVSSSPSSLSVTPRSTPGHWSGRLSQVEVAALNARAEQLFQEGSAQPYMALMRELAQQGLLSEVELAEHATAVSLRERELAVEQGVHAPAAASDATSGAAAAAAVGPQLKAHLLAGLTGEGSSAVGGFGTARSFGVLEEARAAWEGAWPAAGPSAQSPSGGASTAPQGSESLSYPAWAAAMAEEAAAAQYRQPTLSTPASAGSAAATGANQGGDQQQRQQQLQQVARAWWQGQGAVAPSFEEARTAWQQYVEMAGCPAHAPLLEDIITADTELRAARAAVRAAAREATRAALPALSRDSEGSSEEGDAPAKERLLAAQQRADHLNASIADLFRSFVARNGTATAPIGPAAHTGAHSPPSPATTHGDTSSNVRSNVSSSSINPESAWGAISARNKALNPLLVGNNTKAAGSSSLLSIFKPEFLAAAGPAAPAPPEDTAAQAAAEAARREEERSRQWNKYLQTQRKHAESEAAQGQAWPVSAQVAPPYPGARPIVRFQQSIILGPASALTSSQGLAERLAALEASDAAHPATLGLGSPPVMLPDHPSSKRVTMKVKMSELAEEMGLSGSAVEYMKLVAGRSRYDPMTDDLTLVCSTHPTREENRRWCLERVHILAAEAHSVSTVDKPLKGLAKWE